MKLRDKIYFEEPVRDRFYNGFSEDETVVLKYDGKTGIFTMRNFFTLVKPAERLVAKEEDIWLKDISEDMEVLGRNGFERVLQVIRRKVYEPILVVKTKTHKTVVSASHEIPVSKENGEELVRADNLKEGDKIYVADENGENGRYEEIEKIEKDKKWRLSVYGMLTESGGAFISGIFQKSY